MIDKQKLELFKELFDRSESILIMCSSDATRDHLLAASSLYATLKVNTQKDIRFLCPEDFSKKEQDISFLSEVKTKLGHENLSISLDYLEDSIDKVSYHVSDETNKFYLTIKPKKGFPPLSKENVDFSYVGAQADMVVLVGVDDLTSLGKLYVGYENLFNNTALVSINSYETDFGNFKFDILGSSSFSEFITKMLLGLEIFIDSESATNLLMGINEETDGLESYMATADTFETVSKLMRAGARRQKPKTKAKPKPKNKLKPKSKPKPRSKPKTTRKAKPAKKRKTKTKSKNKTTKSKTTKSKTTKSKRTKPGSLKYKPTGFGPSGA